MSEENINPENLRSVYSQVNQNHRHLENLRLAAFCFHFIVFFGVFLFAAGVFQVVTWNGLERLAWSKAAGILVALTFLGIDAYCLIRLLQLQKLARKFEELLGFQQFELLTQPNIIWMEFLKPGFYIIFLIFWLAFS